MSMIEEMWDGEMTDDDGMNLVIKKRQEHFAAIGELHGFWAGCEGTLYEVLLHYCGLNYDVGRSIFAGPRVSAMIEILRRLIENTPIAEDRSNDLAFLLPQLKVINGIRDKLTHHGELGFHLVREAGVEVGYTFIDNANRPGKKANEYVFVITTKQLNECIDDLLRIGSALRRHLNSDFNPWEKSGEVDTWSCKSLSPDLHRQMIRVIPQ